MQQSRWGESSLEDIGGTVKYYVARNGCSIPPVLNHCLRAALTTLGNGFQGAQA